MSEEKIRYGWWSHEQEKVTGSISYTTPNGNTVRVTEVTDFREYNSRWEDMQFVGEVVNSVSGSKIRGTYQYRD